MPYLGTSPNANVYDPAGNPLFGLAEFKCPNIDSIMDAPHIRIIHSQAKLKPNQKYFWQAQAQFAKTGLPWCVCGFFSTVLSNFM